MGKRKILEPYGLLLTGEWIQKLRSSLAATTSYWGEIKRCLQQLLPLKDREDLEFIGEEALALVNQLDSKYVLDDKYLDSSDKDRLRSSLERWEGRLREISKGWILSYPETHINVGKLSKGIKAFLDADEFKALKPLEKQGLNEAAASLLFCNFTSAEFMALRTAESLLKRWYEKRTRNKLGRTAWGQVLEKLNQEFPRKEGRPKELLLLDYLRERRNEVAHPEAVSTPEGASTTFFNVISLWKSLYAKIEFRGDSLPKLV